MKRNHCDARRAWRTGSANKIVEVHIQRVGVDAKNFSPPSVSRHINRSLKEERINNIADKILASRKPLC